MSETFELVGVLGHPSKGRMCHLGGILSTWQNRVGGCQNIEEATNDSGLKDVTSGGQQFLCMVTQWGRKVAYLLYP